MIAELAVFLDAFLRFLALGALLLGILVAATHWAVREGRLEAFGSWPRFVRRWSDPILEPLERGLARRGRNPQEAPLWLLGIVVVVGIVLLSVTRWIVAFFYRAAALRHAGTLGVVVFVLELGFNLMILSLLVRVIGSWLGAGRYNPLTRWTYVLTDWLVIPIQRRLPPFGPFDVSPIVAYIVLLVLRWAVLGALV